MISTTWGDAANSEHLNKVIAHHHSDKNNYRGHVKMSIEQRIDLNNAIRKHPAKNHCPTTFNQKFNIA